MSNKSISTDTKIFQKLTLSVVKKSLCLLFYSLYLLSFIFLGLLRRFVEIVQPKINSNVVNRTV